MQGFFQFLADNPYILLFFTVGMAVWVGKFSVKGYGLGMVAAGVALVVGARGAQITPVMPDVPLAEITTPSLAEIAVMKLETRTKL